MSSMNGSLSRAPSDASDAGSLPWIDESGILRVRRRWAPLSDAEWELLEPLVARFGKTVTRDELLGSASSGKPILPTALNVRITRLRHRVEPLGLRLINVRKRGYILDRVHEIDASREVYESDV